jgi:hypothetical protein
LYTFEIKQWIYSLKSEELILAKKAYETRFSYMKESTFFQLLARLNEEKFIGKIAKGLYYKPRSNDFYKLPSHDKLVDFFTGKGKNGMIIGNRMLYNYHIIDNCDNKYALLTNLMPIKTKRYISNLEVEYLDVDLKNVATNRIIEILEIIENIDDIKEYNFDALKEVVENIVYYYDENSMKKIIETKRYKKRVLKAFSLILKHYNVGNSIDNYLNKGSIYKIPDAILKILEV